MCCSDEREILMRCQFTGLSLQPQEVDLRELLEVPQGQEQVPARGSGQPPVSTQSGG